MATLRKIVIQNFRNIELQELEFSPNVNCISGGNGEGKTNLLDAIWYLSMTKSSFCTSDRYSFRHGTDCLALSGVYEMQGGATARFCIRADGEGKQLKKDDKPYRRISEHIGELPVVMVSPADTAMVSESGEERRRFANAVLSQTDKAYLSGLQQYNRLLQDRNRLLKDGVSDDSLLDAFDVKLSATAVPIYERRRKFCEEIKPAVREFYGRISGGREDVGLEYRSDLDKGDLYETLRNGRNRDMALRFTSSGIQRDDFVFTMDGYPIRRCGSQGQQKSFLVALKIAQYTFMKRDCGFPPMLLLDDLFDKLDIERVSNLLKMVADDDFGQIFLTDSNKTRIRGIVDGITRDRAYFETKGGVFSRNEQD